jgi:cytochrome c oxidase assembly protein subunit 20
MSENEKEYREPGMADALGTLQLDHFSIQTVAEMPCARSALISGLSSGGVLGFARMAATRNLKSSSKWGVLTFALVSTVSWEFCRYQRTVARDELAKMAMSLQSK